METQKTPNSHSNLEDGKQLEESQRLASACATELPSSNSHLSSVAQPRPTLCDPTDHSPPDSSVHGISQARIREWAAKPYSMGSSQLADQTQLSCIEGVSFTTSAIQEAPNK